MSSPTVVLRDIDFDKFLDSGILVDASKDIKHRQKCYVIANLLDIEEIDVSALVKKAIGTFNKDHYVILRLTGTTTKMRNIKNGGRKTYLKVENNFSLSSYLTIQDQDHICLVGSADNDGLRGSAGNDELYGGSGNDWLYGGAGNDKLYGGTGGNNRLFADMLYGNAGNDDLYGNIGNDMLFGNTGNDKLYGGAGHDNLSGGDDNDVLRGGAGNDDLRGGDGDDTLYGDAGDNIYYFSSDSQRDVIHLDSRSEGVDTIDFSSKLYFMTKWDHQKQEAQFYLFDDGTTNNGSPAYDGKNHITVKGFSMTRKLLIKNYRSSAAELTVHKITYKVKGQEETRDFQTLLPKDTKEIFLPTYCDLVGLHGPDNRPVSGVVQKTFVDKTGEINALFMPLPNISIRNIDLGKFLDSGILMDASKDTRFRRECYVISNLDPDIVNIDVAALVKKAIGTFNNEDHYVILRLTGTTTKIRNIKNSGLKTYLKVENNFSLPSHLTIQDQDHICLVGSSGNNTLDGSKGKDNLYGGAGDDKLYAGANSNNSWCTGILYGNAGNDELYGGFDDDELIGGAGNDRLYGSAGDDLLHGGAGNDELSGGAGGDKLYGWAGDDVLDGGVGDDELFGGVDEDWLLFDALSGDDKLSGGPGNDKLHGGNGDNVYHFIAYSNTGYDVIQLDSDSKGVDRIHFKFSKQYFITKWDGKKQEAQFYLFDDGTTNNGLPAYNGINHITVKGFSKTRKLFIKNGEDSSVPLTVHKVTYEVKGQEKTRDFQTLLPKGTKEVFLPNNCNLVSLHGPNNCPVNGAFQKTFVDKTGEIKALFGIR